MCRHRKDRIGERKNKTLILFKLSWNDLSESISIFWNAIHFRFWCIIHTSVSSVDYKLDSILLLWIEELFFFCWHCVLRLVTTMKKKTTERRKKITTWWILAQMAHASFYRTDCGDPGHKGVFCFSLFLFCNLRLEMTKPSPKKNIVWQNASIHELYALFTTISSEIFVAFCFSYFIYFFWDIRRTSSGLVIRM